MQEAVKRGREDDAGNSDQRESAIKGVYPGEDFSAVSLQRPQRSHSRQDHRRVGKGIDPGPVFEPVIACHSDQQ